MPGGKGAVGRLSAVGGSSITVKTPGGGTVTYTLASTAWVLLDDQQGQAGDLAVGQFVLVTSADGTTATVVSAHTHPGPPPGGPPPPDGPPPGP